MNKRAVAEENKHVPLPNCPFLTLRTSSNHNDQGALENIICEAGGGFVLGTMESTAPVQEMCRSCDIPPSLDLKYACLYLVPFRVFQENHVQSYYGCRWYFNLNPQKVPENMNWCIGCRHWFPRPPESLIEDRFAFSHRFLRIYLNPSENENLFLPNPTDDKRRWYEKLRDMFYW